MISYTAIHELIQTILVEAGIQKYVAALPMGEQRYANLVMLIEKAVQFETTSYHGLFHFIRYIEQLEKYDVDFGEANLLDEASNTVRIMSIHKSKGLEFPICFVAGLHKKFNKMDLTKSVLLDIDLGIGGECIRPDKRTKEPTIRRNVMLKKMELDLIGEELRILYVALTRAKEKLIMTGVIDQYEKKQTQMIERYLNETTFSFIRRLGCNSYLDFVMGAMLQPKQEYLECIRVLTNDDLQRNSIAKEIDFYLLRNKFFSEQFSCYTNQTFLEQIENRLSFTYPLEILGKIPTKTTVSELKKASMLEKEENAIELYHNSEEEEITPCIPKFIEKSTEISGTTRGSAYHKVLELLELEKIYDFATGGKNDTVDGAFLEIAILEPIVKQELESYFLDGRLSKEYYEAVSAKQISWFLVSKVARRMYLAQKKKALYREQPFVITINADRLDREFPQEEVILVQGIIDAYFEEEGGLVLLDYKTDKVKQPEELTQRYYMQLNYYQEALERLTGKVVKEKILYPRLQATLIFRI